MHVVNGKQHDRQHEKHQSRAHTQGIYMAKRARQLRIFVTEAGCWTELHTGMLMRVERQLI